MLRMAINLFQLAIVGAQTSLGAYQTTLYVDAAAGSDANDGSSLASAFASIRQAASVARSSTLIYVANGTYSNLDNGAAVAILNVSNILLRNLPGHFPKVVFNGSEGIIVDNVDHLEIAGFGVGGVAAQITQQEATADRLLQSARFSGRGIYIRRSTRVLVHDNEVHHTPGSGIRVDYSDYTTIENNVVYNCTWWSSNAESAIMIAESQDVDAIDVVKMVIRHNTVFDNVNRISYYDADWQHLTDPPRESYGSFVVDGSGVHVTRNSASYHYGRFALSSNVCWGNGIAGLVVHETDRALVYDNVLFANGQVSKDPPTLRPASTGIVITRALNTTVYNNSVSANPDDQAYAISSGSTLISGGLNDVCNGEVQSGFAAYVNRICEQPPSLPPSPAPPTCGSCRLVTNGTQIVREATGQPVVLRGMGLGYWLLQEGYMMAPEGCDGCPGTQWQMKLKYLQGGWTIDQVEAFYAQWRDSFITKADIDDIASMGFNTIRLAMHYVTATGFEPTICG